MGFEVPRKTYRLVFEDDDYAGAEVVCGSTSLGNLLSFHDNADSMRRFGDEILISWNVTDGGQPVPATGEGMLAIDSAFARAIVEAWAEALTGIARPLGEPSSNGNGSLAASIPMVPL